MPQNREGRARKLPEGCNDMEGKRMELLKEEGVLKI